MDSRINKHVPYPFNEAAERIIYFLESKKTNDIQKYIDKINDAKYIIMKDQKERKIDILLRINFKVVEIKKKYFFDFAGLTERIVVGRYPYIVKNIVIINVSSKDGDEDYLILCAIHELLHLISSQHHGKSIYSGFNIYRIIEERKNHSIYSYISYLSLNEAVTEQLSYTIYNETSKEDKKVTAEKYMNGYYLSHIIVKILNHKILDEREALEWYLTNKAYLYELRVGKNLEGALRDLDNLLRKCERLMDIIFTEKLIDNEEYIAKEIEKLCGYYIYKLYDGYKDVEYFKSCLNHKMFKNILINLN